jgi:hypothetical protein
VGHKNEGFDILLKVVTSKSLPIAVVFELVYCGRSGIESKSPRCIADLKVLGFETGSVPHLFSCFVYGWRFLQQVSLRRGFDMPVQNAFEVRCQNLFGVSSKGSTTKHPLSSPVRPD